MTTLILATCWILKILFTEVMCLSVLRFMTSFSSIIIYNRSCNETKINTVIEFFKELLQDSLQKDENCEKCSVADKHHKWRSTKYHINVMWV